MLSEMLNRSIEFLMEDFIKIALKDFTSAKSIIKIALGAKECTKLELNMKKKGFMYRLL